MEARTLTVRVPWLLGLLLGLCLLPGCGGHESSEPGSADSPISSDFADPELEPFTGDLDALRERRLIRALVTPSRTDFFLDHGRILGIQAEFLREFGRRINRGVSDPAQRVRIKYVPVDFHELLPALLDGRGDIAAAFLTPTEDRRTRVHFTDPFREDVAEVLVTHRGTDPPARTEDLSGRRVLVLRGSSYAEHLRALNRSLEADDRVPVELEIADPRLRSEDLLEFVNAGVIPCTLVDDYKAALWSQVLEDIVVHDTLRVTEGNEVAWAIRPDSPQLEAELNTFVRRAREGALLGNVLLERYFGDVQWLTDPTARSERDKLSRYLELFRRYGDRYGFDPLALAAQAYQESRLDPTRVSGAGAVGLMQVLPSTAADPRVAIDDISDPEDNVHAGAKYLAFLRDHYFDDPDLREWDRRAFCWAAYNAGPRKVREARRLAAEMGLDPDVWFGHVEVAMGRTVGREPVRYVDNVYRYYVVYRAQWAQAAERREAVREIE